MVAGAMVSVYPMEMLAFPPDSGFDALSDTVGCGMLSKAKNENPGKQLGPPPPGHVLPVLVNFCTVAPRADFVIVWKKSSFAWKSNVPLSVPFRVFCVPSTMSLFGLGHRN